MHLETPLPLLYLPRICPPPTDGLYLDIRLPWKTQRRIQSPKSTKGQPGSHLRVHTFDIQVRQSWASVVGSPLQSLSLCYIFWCNTHNLDAKILPVKWSMRSQLLPVCTINVRACVPKSYVLKLLAAGLN
jgi:hypothetical protein